MEKIILEYWIDIACMYVLEYKLSILEGLLTIQGWPKIVIVDNDLSPFTYCILGHSRYKMCLDIDIIW